MRKIFTLFAAFAVAFSATAAQPAGNKNKQKVAPKQEQVSEWQKAAMSWGNKAKAAKSNSLLQGELLIPVTPDLSNNKLPSYTSVTLPMNGTIAWAPTGTVIVPSMGYTNSAAMGFTFTVAEGRGVNIAFRDFPGYCILASSQTLNDETEIRRVGSNRPILKLVQKIDISGEWTSGALAAGSYTLFAVYDPEYEGTFNFSLSLQDADPVELKSYADIDYSTALTVGKKVYGALGMGEGEVVDPQSVGNAPFDVVAVGYTLNVEAGKTYSLNFQLTNGAHYTYSLYPFILQNSLTGNWNEDILMDGYYGDILGGSITSPITGTVKLLLLCPADLNYAEYVYTMQLEEDTPVNFKEITLPYCNELVSFAHDKSFYFNEECYMMGDWMEVKGRARAFKFTLNGESSLEISACNDEEGLCPYIWIYSEDGMSNLLAQEWRELNVTLQSGTYYLVLSDNRGNDYENYFCNLNIVLNQTTAEECDTPDEQPEGGVCEPMDLEELFQNAKTVTYTADLFYVDSGELACGESLFGAGVAGDDDYYNGEAFCNVYKVSLKAGDNLNVYHHTSDDAYLRMFTFEEGDLVEVNNNGWDDAAYYEDYWGNSSDSYFEFTATTAGDYYIVATTYDERSKEDFVITISAYGKDDFNYEITGFEASANNIEANINNLGEILGKLSGLKVYGVIGSCRVPLENMASITYGNWEISADRTTATYIASDEKFAYADDVEPLVITIVPGSGINDVEGDANLSVYAANGVINILGTQGGEDVAVYNVMGSKIAAVKATAEITTVNIPCAGVYVVRVGNKSFKVIGQ